MFLKDKHHKWDSNNASGQFDEIQFIEELRKLIECIDSLKLFRLI